MWFAEYQTNGRGQRGNKWESSTGKNLTFSILLKPTFLTAAQQFAISEVISLGICKYLCLKGLQPKIKWPNDIYINDKKICGILIEHSISGANLAVSICGIGLNLNQTQFSKDAPNPTSVAIELKTDSFPKNKEMDLRNELNILLEEILDTYKNLKEGTVSLEQLHSEYINHLYRYNQEHSFLEITQKNNLNMPVEKIGQGNVIKAKITDVTLQGCLVLSVLNGTNNTTETKSYSFKEIKFIV